MNDGPGVSDLYLSENHRKEEEPAPGTPPQSSIYNSIIANTGTEKVCGMSTTARNLTLSNGGNITTDSSCGFEESTDLQNTDPRLASLADNGGPVQTHALLANSPAIDQLFRSMRGRMHAESPLKTAMVTASWRPTRVRTNTHHPTRPQVRTSSSLW